MNRDRLLADVARAIRAAYPDRAEQMLDEMEKLMPVVLPANVRPAVLHAPMGVGLDEEHRAIEIIRGWRYGVPLLLPDGWRIDWMEMHPVETQPTATLQRAEAP